MRVYVTGAGGFTGQHLLAALKNAGYAAIPARANILDAEALSAEIAQFRPDFIVHLAAISFVAHEDVAEIYRVNVIGAENVLQACLKAQPALRKILFASSANIYDPNAESPVKENVQPKPVNHYAASKLAMEFMTRTYSDRLPILIVRPFNYTGVGQDKKFLVPKIVDHFRSGDKKIELGNIDVRREFNDVRFVVDAYIRLLEVPQCSEPVNICTGVSHSIRDIFEVLENLTGHQMEIEINPDFVRTNEIPELYGDPSRLIALMDRPLKIGLQETLQEMLSV